MGSQGEYSDGLRFTEEETKLGLGIKSLRIANISPARPASSSLLLTGPSLTPSPMQRSPVNCGTRAVRTDLARPGHLCGSRRSPVQREEI